jgi:hypothetical protein
MMNHYFDTTLAVQHDQLIQRAIAQLILLKSQQSHLGQDITQQLYGIIYNNLKPLSQVPNQPPPPQDQDF